MAPDTTEHSANAAYVALPSFGQRRLWVLDRLMPGSSVYNEPRVERIRGALDVSALGKSFDALMARHDVLRTHFEVIDGEPRQVVVASLRLPMPVDDLTALPEADREPEA